MNDDLIARYREQFPAGEDSSGIDSNPSCAYCDHSRGLHETKVRHLPYGYCVHIECDCTCFKAAE